MKRIICLSLSFLLSFIMIVPAYAADDQNNFTDNVIYFDDGSYLTVHTPVITASNNPRSTSNTITATRPITYTNRNGEIEWEYNLVATFSYVYGSSVTCTNATYNYTINKNSWHFSNGSTSRSGGTAYGYGTFKDKVLFITTQTVNIDTYLTCDIYGNLS